MKALAVSIQYLDTLQIQGRVIIFENRLRPTTIFYRYLVAAFYFLDRVRP
jgi:hypothetical protein